MRKHLGALLLVLLATGTLLAGRPAHAATFTVTNTNDSGAGSLRQAILDANSVAGADTIDFDIPDDPAIPGPEVKTIKPLTALPDITDPVVIDGYTQNGASVNKLARGTDAVLKVEISGQDSPQAAEGLMIRTDDSLIRGLVINRFGTNLQICNCMFPSTAQATGNTVEGNFIGTDPSGSAGRGGGGVLIFEDAPENQIGGASPGARNLISGNDGAAAVDVRSSGNTLEGNLIGTKKGGKDPLGNAGHGVFVFGNVADGNVIGGLSPGAANTVAFNGTGGVIVFGGGAGGNRILSNSVFRNAGPGIDLGGNGRTPNDPGDADTGSNELQNYPVVSSARQRDARTVIRGTLASIPNTAFTLQLFSNPKGENEGRKLVGTLPNVSTDAGGQAAFTLRLNGRLGGRITATATDEAAANTSEFSVPRRVERAGR